MEDLNIKKVIIAAVITLVLLFAGNYLITDYRIDRQLKQELEELPQIKEVKISQEDNYNLNILLKDVENLQELNLKLRKRIKEVLKTDDYKLRLSGVESSNLKQIYNKINLALYESLLTEKYTKFGAAVERYQEEYNLKKAEVRVDDDYIYLTLADNTGALYKVLTRAKVGERDG